MYSSNELLMAMVETVGGDAEWPKHIFESGEHRSR